jgi:uncharacterized protein involved in cysteine biosynthesis
MQWRDPAIRQVIRWTLLLAVLAFFALAFGVYLLIGWLIDLSPWLEGLAQVGGVVGSLIVAWFTFPSLSAAIAGLFAERAIQAVEDRHYPGRGPARPINAMESLASALKLAGLALAVNVLALPFLIVPPVYVLIAWGLNGWLLGREYFDMVALRRMDGQAAQRLYTDNRSRLTLAGVVIAVSLTIPFVNLVAPILSAAFMVHVLGNMVNRDAGGVAREPIRS